VKLYKGSASPQGNQLRILADCEQIQLKEGGGLVSATGKTKLTALQEAVREQRDVVFEYQKALALHNYWSFYDRCKRILGIGGCSVFLRTMSH
jgi:hypothetical protein